VRLTGGDPTWGEAWALGRHAWTQPLPTFLGVRVQELGEGLQAALRIGDTAIGLAVVFALLLPRRGRHLAAMLVAVTVLGGFLTGRLGVWPLSLLALLAFATDDRAYGRVLPRRLRARLPAPRRRDVPGFVPLARGFVALVVA